MSTEAELERLDQLCQKGSEAWKRLKQGMNWNDWLMVGEALRVGREWAMNQAGTNQPAGKGYNIAFGAWLEKYGFDDMDKAARSRLFKVMDNLPAIQKWRDTLGQSHRLTLNHPASVLRKWESQTQGPSEKSQKPTLKDENIKLDTEKFDLQNHIKEIEADRDSLKAYVKQLESVIIEKQAEIEALKNEEKVAKEIYKDIFERLPLGEQQKLRKGGGHFVVDKVRKQSKPDEETDAEFIKRIDEYGLFQVENLLYQQDDPK
jgi:hypothetical protein